MAKIKTVMSDSCRQKHAAIVNAFANGNVPADAKIIYKGRNTVYSINDDGETINIKAFRTPSFPNNLVYTTLRQSKARRSYENALRLLELGINTPQPIAYIEVKEGCRLTRSYYMSRQMDQLETVRNWDRFPFKDRLLDEMSIFMKQLIDKQIYHRDFSPGNILFERDPDGSFKFYLVDLNRMEFGVTDRSKMMRMFKAITTIPEQNRELALHYAATNGLDADQTVGIAARQLQNYLDQKARLAQIKKFFKN